MPIPAALRRLFVLIAAPLIAAAPAAARDQATPPVAAVPAANWQHEGSDIPADPAWRTGTLANGLRYAVRRNARPPGTLAIRVGVNVGALMESDEQQGWAHLMEHMAFRGTADYPDGEPIKIWQRLGASFGSDTNAGTGMQATVYKLDLPKSDADSYAQAMDVLAEMMASARIDPALLDTERKVVIAERGARKTPLGEKVEAVSEPLFQAGMKARDRDVIGTVATLNNATAERLKAFYHLWYRPERAVVVVVGDADPAMLEAGVRKAFGNWRGVGAAPAEPDYGTPTAPAEPAATVVDPQASNIVQVAWQTPHDDSPMTAARVQDELVRSVSTAVLARRLVEEARKGQAIVNATASNSGGPHDVDRLGMVLMSKPGGWRDALEAGFGVINAAIAAPPSRGEIQDQLSRIRQSLAKSVTDRETALSASLADAFMGDVASGDVTADRQYYLDLFDATRASITPERVEAKLRELLAPDPRMLVMSAVPVEGGDAAAVTALATLRHQAAAKREDVRDASLEEIKLPGPPGKIASTDRIDDLGIERVRFANGVELAFKRTDYDKDRILLYTRVGHGLLNRAPGDAALQWSAGALYEAGFGPFTREEFSRAAAGKQVGGSVRSSAFEFGIGTNTDSRDLADALKVQLAMLTRLRFEQTPLDRLKEALAANYATLFENPGSVFSAFGTVALYSGDARFRGVTPPDEVSALTLGAFRDYWTHATAEGPIRISVVGDFDRDALIAAVAATYGALPPRSDDAPTAAELAVSPPAPSAEPLVLHHRGAADQALVLRNWRVPGRYEAPEAHTALGLLTAILKTRMTEQFRAEEGGTYSPQAALSQPDELPGYGRMSVGAQLAVGRIGDFEATLDRILKALIADGPDADELARAKATALSALERGQTSNGYWFAVVSGMLEDPRALDSARTWRARIDAVDADAVRKVAAEWLKPGESFEIRVLPEEAPAKP